MKQQETNAFPKSSFKMGFETIPLLTNFSTLRSLC